MDQVVTPFIEIVDWNPHDSIVRQIVNIIERRAHGPTKEQARALLEQPISTNDLTIYRDEQNE